MLVKELVDKLLKMPQDANIVIVIPWGDYNNDVDIDDEFEPKLLANGKVEIYL
jgi:hypothetical protein